MFSDLAVKLNNLLLDYVKTVCFAVHLFIPTHTDKIFYLFKVCPTQQNAMTSHLEYHKNKLENVTQGNIQMSPTVN